MRQARPATPRARSALTAPRTTASALVTRTAATYGLAEGTTSVHYHYGICPACGQSTYRYPSEQFYRHMGGAVECVSYPPGAPLLDALVYRNVSSTAGLASYAHGIGG